LAASHFTDRGFIAEISRSIASSDGHVNTNQSALSFSYVAGSISALIPPLRKMRIAGRLVICIYDSDRTWHDVMNTKEEVYTENG
jgi:hypothetical protein